MNPIEAHDGKPGLIMKVLKKGWAGWKKIAEIFGNFQMTLLLTVMYWTAFALVAIPFKLRSDPLAIKKSAKPRWVPRKPVSDILENMRKQG